MGFTHLHVHTEYSLLDGKARIKDLVAGAKELGMTSLAITDHGSMFGVIDFYKECKANGIKPILGCEVYTAARKMTDRDRSEDKHQGHLVLLAENDEGYHNLMKIVSRGYTKGFYYKPRVDKDVLREFSGGIIATSACLQGDVQRRLLFGDYDGAKREAIELADIFGKDNFFLEIQDQGLDEERRILPDMIRLSEELGLSLVATNDCHYVKREEASAHDVLLCIQTASNIDDEDRMRFPNDEFYLKSEEEMREIFKEFPEACDNTEVIAERCNVEIEFGKLHLPDFKVPCGMTPEQYLRKLCDEGLAERYGDESHRERLEYELGIIEQMGYVEYFLIVWDFINYARSQNIMVGPGRGSAAGSIVSYVLHITDVDPIRYNLIFERFLNPERVSMPDIDIDFCYERRHEVIEYVIDKYGEENVSQIITFGTMKARAAVRDIGRVLNVSYQETDSIAKAIPNTLGITIDRALEMNKELRERYESDPTCHKVLDYARSLEGMPRHASTHAAGVVISKKAIDEYVPLYMSDKGTATQFTMTTIEELGLLKMDFLGLRNLTVIRDALAMIEENHGVKIDFSKMEFNDPEVFKLIASGNTQGIFQLESGGMTQFMKNLNPDCLEDIIAGISLYRPGPMEYIPTYIENKKNPDKVTYTDPHLKPILEPTYGCLVYQEQVMQIVRELAGYTYGHSDILRRAMGKKKMDVMLKEEKSFIEGCVKNGISANVAKEIFSHMVSFAQYAFNKSHAAAYAFIGYETAYLKAHYPVEFMAALMTSTMGEAGHTAAYLKNCNEMGIEVLPPSVTKSQAKFTVEDGKIRYGLLGIKHVGEGIVNEIVRAREEKGVPDSIFTLVRDCDIHELKKNAIEAMIKAGAFDDMNPNRAAHLAVYEQVMQQAQNSSKMNIAGQTSMFDTDREIMEDVSGINRLPDVKNFPEDILGRMEKEMLGVYLTWNPLGNYEEIIRRNITATSSDLVSGEETAVFKDGDTVVMAGIITAIRKITTKKDRMMAFITVEDMYGSFDVVVFPGVYDDYRAILNEDKVIAVKGKINFKEDEDPVVLADRITDMDKIKGSGSEEVIKLRITAGTMEAVLRLMEEHKGDIPVVLYENGRSFRAKRDRFVDGSDEFIKKMTGLLGKENVKWTGLL